MILVTRNKIKEVVLKTYRNTHHKESHFLEENIINDFIFDELPF